MTSHDEALRALEKKYETRLANWTRLYEQDQQNDADGRWNRAHMLQCQDVLDDIRALLTTRQEVAPVADSLQSSMEAYANALAQHRDSEVVAFRIRRKGDESLGPMWVDGKPDASMISEWEAAGFWVEYAHAGPQGSIPSELDEAINCVVSDLEMIAAGRDTVTGDPVSSAQAQRIAKGAHDHLLAAWDAAATNATGQTSEARGVEAWVQQKPDREGVYAVRGYELGSPYATAIVEVREFDNGLGCNLHCRNSEGDPDEWDEVANFSGKFQWLYLAPIPKHGTSYADAAMRQEACHD